MNFQDYLNEIKICLDNKCYVASLMMSLVLPDICGKVMYPNAETSSRYKKWYSSEIGKYMKPCHDDNDIEKMPWLSADVVYSLRCSLFHEALPNIKKTEIKQEENKIDKFHISFTDSARFSEAKISSDSLGKTERSLSIDAKYLSEQLLNCATNYYNDNKQMIDEAYKTIIDGFGDKYLWTN